LLVGGERVRIRDQQNPLAFRRSTSAFSRVFSVRSRRTLTARSRSGRISCIRNGFSTELHTTPHGLRLCVEDNGSGVPDASGYSWESRGLGLSTMRYRANLMGGSLHITPSDGKGVRVVCIVPREDDNGKE
jgi:signal transduction histidine kinase